MPKSWEFVNSCSDDPFHLLNILVVCTFSHRECKSPFVKLMWLFQYARINHKIVCCKELNMESQFPITGSSGFSLNSGYLWALLSPLGIALSSGIFLSSLIVERILTTPGLS